MALPPLNGLAPLTIPLLSPLEEDSSLNATQNAELVGKDSVELSMRAEQMLGQRISGAQAVTDDPALSPSVVRTTSQIDSVTISPMAKNALKTLQNASQTTEPAATAATNQASSDAAGSQGKNMLASATLNSGATVSIYASAYSSGEKKPFYLAPEQKITAEITKADGSTQTLTITANTVISEDDQGNLRVQSGPQKDDNNILNERLQGTNRSEVLQGTDRNDVIINFTGADEIRAGKGNDTVISFDDANTVDLGEGDNRLKSLNGGIHLVTAADGDNRVANATAGTISFGNGNNTISGEAGKIILGDGNNTVDVDSVNQIQAGNGNNSLVAGTTQSISAGNGDNTVRVKKISETVYYNALSEAQPTIQLGDGNNVVEAEAAKMISAGDGNNTVRLNSSAGAYTGQYLGLVEQKIQLGNGNNVLSANFASSVSLGNGDNRISGNTIYNLTAGDGNNSLDVGFLLDRGEWTLGDGKNDIHIALQNGSVKTGDGDNTLAIDELLGGGSSITTGAGNDRVHIRGDVMGLRVNLGNGDNQFTVDGNAAYLEYAGGDGQDDVSIKGFLAHSSLLTGKGNDAVTVLGFLLDSQISMAPGSSGLNLNGLIINSVVNGNAAGNISDEEKNTALNAVDRFMARWKDAGSTGAVGA